MFLSRETACKKIGELKWTKIYKVEIVFLCVSCPCLSLAHAKPSVARKENRNNDGVRLPMFLTKVVSDPKT